MTNGSSSGPNQIKEWSTIPTRELKDMREELLHLKNSLGKSQRIVFESNGDRHVSTHYFSTNEEFNSELKDLKVTIEQQRKINDVNEEIISGLKENIERHKKIDSNNSEIKLKLQLQIERYEKINKSNKKIIEMLENKMHKFKTLSILATFLLTTSLLALILKALS